MIKLWSFISDNQLHFNAISLYNNVLKDLDLGVKRSLTK